MRSLLRAYRLDPNPDAGELESWRAGELESWRAGELERARISTTLDAVARSDGQSSATRAPGMRADGLRGSPPAGEHGRLCLQPHREVFV